MSVQFSVEALRNVTEPRTTIQTNSNGVVIPCRAISVDTTGTYVVTLPSGASTVTVYLAAGIIHYISTAVALGSPSGTVTYWY
jgi:hypothetical protein